MNIVTSDEFISMLDEGIHEDNNSNIDFNDEIVSIGSVGNRDTYDINVSGDDHFFYANNILTHNSATGSNLDIKSVDNDSVSDSVGTVQTADFIMFLLQNPQMKEEGIMTCKVTKNRFNGRTDFWDMNIDYTRMKFSDVVVDGHGMGKKEISTTIATIVAEDIQKIKEHDNSLDIDFNSTPSNSKIEEDFDVNEYLGLS